MTKVCLQFSNWKVDLENKMLYRLVSKQTNEGLTEDLVKHLRYSNFSDVRRYLANYERCTEDVIIQSLRDSGL